MTKRGSRGGKKGKPSQYKEPPPKEEDIFKSTNEKNVKGLLNSQENSQDDKTISEENLQPPKETKKLVEFDKAKAVVEQRDKKIKELEVTIKGLKNSNTSNLKNIEGFEKQVEDLKKQRTKVEKELEKIHQEVEQQNQQEIKELEDIKKVVLDKIKNVENPKDLDKYLEIYKKLSNIELAGPDNLSNRYLEEIEKIHNTIRYDIRRDNSQILALEKRLVELINKLDSRYYELNRRFERIDEVYEDLHGSRRYKHLYEEEKRRRYYIEREPSSNRKIQFYLGLIFAIILFGVGLYLVISATSPFWGVILFAISFASIGITTVGDVIKKIFGHE